jgi:hypothetical protein
MPYRAKPRSDEHGAAEAGAWDLVVPFAGLWLVSLARVAWVLMRRGTFGAQDTLAALALVALPALLVRSAWAPR